MGVLGFLLGYISFISAMINPNFNSQIPPYVSILSPNFPLFSPQMKASFPPNFTTWKEAIEDEDTFLRFRDQVFH